MIPTPAELGGLLATQAGRAAAPRAGSGVLTTTQQVSTALGVATLGTLFTALRLEDVAGSRTALLVVLSIEVVMALGLALLSVRLPDPRA